MLILWNIFSLSARDGRRRELAEGAGGGSRRLKPRLGGRWPRSPPTRTRGREGGEWRGGGRRVGRGGMRRVTSGWGQATRAVEYAGGGGRRRVREYVTLRRIAAAPTQCRARDERRRHPPGRSVSRGRVPCRRRSPCAGETSYRADGGRRRASGARNRRQAGAARRQSPPPGRQCRRRPSQ